MSDSGFGGTSHGVCFPGGKVLVKYMWMYLVVFGAALGLDLIPFTPPAWMAMVFLLVEFDLNPWLVLVCGVAGSACGRFLFSLYVRQFSAHFLKRHKNEDLEFLGKKLTQSLWKAWLFVLLYTLVPISTSPLFTAAGIARVKAKKILPPFVCGKLVSDAVVLFAGRSSAGDVADMLHGTFSLKGILTGIFGLVIVAGLFVINWRTLLRKRKLEFTFRIWK